MPGIDMETYHLFSGTIKVCTKEEFREQWKLEPAKRHQLWIETEITAEVILSSPSDLQAIIKAKIQSPGHIRN